MDVDGYPSPSTRRDEQTSEQSEGEDDLESSRDIQMMRNGSALSECEDVIEEALDVESLFTGDSVVPTVVFPMTAHGITAIANLKDLLIQKKKGKSWMISNTWRPSVMDD